MRIIKEKISVEEIKLLAQSRFGNMVKAVIDVEKGIMAVDAELHSDEEALLIENGSKQEDLWGINIYPEILGDEMIEYDSMINLKPSIGNRTRGIDDPEISQKINRIVKGLIVL
jgi:hypothetical protein